MQPRTRAEPMTDQDTPAAAETTPPAIVPAAARLSQDPPAPRRRGSRWPWLLVLAALGTAGWFWYDGQRRSAAAVADATDLRQRLEALESRGDTLRRDSRGHSQRLQQAETTNRVLRDELLGLGQRSALLETQVAKLADASREGAEALRLDEAELLLSIGEQRLRLAADLDGARRAYALADAVLDPVDRPGMLDLKQTLAQERADLDALRADPRQSVVSALDALARAMPAAVDAEPLPEIDPEAPWWERALARLVRVTPSDNSLALGGEERRAARQALDLELTLARAAAERRDPAALQAALDRADAWLLRLWPESAERSRQREALRRIAAMPLNLEVPTLGSTRAQLRAQRGG